MPSSAVLSSAVLCHAKQCHAVPGCAMPTRAVPYRPGPVRAEPIRSVRRRLPAPYWRRRSSPGAVPAPPRRSAPRRSARAGGGVISSAVRGRAGWGGSGHGAGRGPARRPPPVRACAAAGGRALGLHAARRAGARRAPHRLQGRRRRARSRVGSAASPCRGPPTRGGVRGTGWEARSAAAGSPGRGVACPGAAGPARSVAVSRTHVPPRPAAPSRGGERGPWGRGGGGRGDSPGPAAGRNSSGTSVGLAAGAAPPRPPSRSRPAERSRGGGGPHPLVCPPVGPMGTPRIGLWGDVGGPQRGGPECAPSRHPGHAWAGLCPGQALVSGRGAERGRRGDRPPGSLPPPAAGRARVGASRPRRPAAQEVTDSRRPAGASPSWETRWQPGSTRGCPVPPHPSRSPVEPLSPGGPAAGAPGATILPGARCWRAGLAAPPGAASLLRAGLAAPPGPSTPRAGTRAAWSGWGSWKSGSGPCPAPRGGTAGGREPAPCRGGPLPAPPTRCRASGRWVRRRRWGRQGTFPVAAENEGGGPCGPGGAVPRAPPAGPPRVLCRQRGLVRRSVHSGEGPPGRPLRRRGRPRCVRGGGSPRLRHGGPRALRRKGEGGSAAPLGETVWSLSPLRAGSPPVAEFCSGAAVGSVGLLSVPRHSLPPARRGQGGWSAWGRVGTARALPWL